MKINKYLFAALVVLVVFTAITLSLPAFAADMLAATQGEPSPALELLSTLLGGERAAQWLTGVGFVCYLLTHIRAWLPVTWVDKLPTWLIQIIETISGNYKGTKNEVDSTINRTL